MSGRRVYARTGRDLSLRKKSVGSGLRPAPPIWLRPIVASLAEAAPHLTFRPDLWPPPWGFRLRGSFTLRSRPLATGSFECPSHVHQALRDPTELSRKRLVPGLFQDDGSLFGSSAKLSQVRPGDGCGIELVLRHQVSASGAPRRSSTLTVMLPTSLRFDRS
jgi:hypothetical protein